MSYYELLPHPTFDEVDYGTWEEGFTSDECDKIIQLGESLTAIDSTVQSSKGHNTGAYNDGIRKSKNSWIKCTNDTEWLYDRIGKISRTLNGMHWRFDITGFNEDLQYTRYNDDSSYYGWHIDGQVKSDNPPRKLSMTIQLSDPSEYEGGDFQINGSQLHTLPKQKGLSILFPSYTLHQVTPVTKGIRRSLVVWLCGPAFR
tara:strand:- start:254 stop:856 length:603 start_codon:yes stop_codon:yes gene_type:complete